MTTRYDNSGAGDWALETRAIHVGHAPDEQTSARSLPIYNTTAYVFDSAEHAANRFNLSDAGPIYSRLTNPTVDAVEQRPVRVRPGRGDRRDSDAGARGRSHRHVAAPLRRHGDAVQGDAAAPGHHGDVRGEPG